MKVGTSYILIRGYNSQPEIGVTSTAGTGEGNVGRHIHSPRVSRGVSRMMYRNDRHTYPYEMGCTS